MQNTRPNLLGIVSSVIFLILTLLIVVSILIGVYHASIVMIAYSLAPVFTIVLPAATILLCGGVIFLSHPVHNLLCLISVFFSTVALYLHVGAEFLAFLFLIVYVGAIAILFLFVIMLLQLKVVAAAPAPFASLRAKVLGATAFIAILGLIDTLSTSLSEFFAISNVGTLKAGAATTENLIWFVNNQFSDILLFSDILYTYHCFLFFIAGLLLLTAMLGAIILATSATDNTAD